MQSYLLALILTWIILAFFYASLPKLLARITNHADDTTVKVVRGVLLGFYLISFAYSVAGVVVLLFIH